MWRRRHSTYILQRLRPITKLRLFLEKAKFYKVPEEPLQKFKMENKDCGCSDDCVESCAYDVRKLECPPHCQKVRNCSNRFVSEGRCSKKIRLVKTDTKGYGVKAIQYGRRLGAQSLHQSLV
ncbi:hypothetical protein CRE_09718 [Caenorhabditis remanei]|uniref:Uncharacterized protein n=1 Tax=Caenorhabditis remanei TaxID=31234 RepID=E3N4X8_CAERE|nr:hypothetical protein CRE_09718 [Caenorhabditis remanei]